MSRNYRGKELGKTKQVQNPGSEERAERTRRGDDWAPRYITDLRKSFSECVLILSMFPFGNDWYHYLLYSRCHISINATRDFRLSSLNLDYIYIYDNPSEPLNFFAHEMPMTITVTATRGVLLLTELML